MIYYLPNVGTVVENAPHWQSNRIYLMYYGESIEDVQVSLAQLTMFNPEKRTNLIVVYCKGERP